MDSYIKGLQLQRGDYARKLSQMAFISCSRFAGQFREKISHWDPVKCIEAMEEAFGEPSYSLENLGDGPLKVWVLINEESKNVIHIEGWKGAEYPRFYIFSNEEPGVLNKELVQFIKWLNRCVRFNCRFQVINGGAK